LVAGRRLAFTWRSPYTGPGQSLVTIELEAVEDGTAITLIHEHLPADRVESHGGGWGQILDRLASELAADVAIGGT
jgi:uncharacterized protein YndB with AHSA1/START domain